MQYTYTKDLQAAVKPGTRHWVCALRLNPGLTRYVRNLQPVLIEACCRSKPDDEDESRKKGAQTQFVVPVKPDGTLDWKRVQGLSHLNWYQNNAQCVARYDGLISEISREMDLRITAIKARQTDMQSRTAGYAVQDGT